MHIDRGHCLRRVWRWTYSWDQVGGKLRRNRNCTRPRGNIYHLCLQKNRHRSKHSLRAEPLVQADGLNGDTSGITIKCSTVSKTFLTVPIVKRIATWAPIRRVTASGWKALDAGRLGKCGLPAHRRTDTALLGSAYAIGGGVKELKIANACAIDANQFLHRRLSNQWA